MGDRSDKCFVSCFKLNLSVSKNRIASLPLITCSETGSPDNNCQMDCMLVSIISKFAMICFNRLTFSLVAENWACVNCRINNVVRCITGIYGFEGLVVRIDLPACANSSAISFIILFTGPNKSNSANIRLISA